MKSKRVTRLMACVLSVAMCASPVWASSGDYKDESSKTIGGDITTEMGPYAPILSVNVPTKARIQVNPMYDETVTSVNKFTIASKSLLITNKSYDTDAGTGLPITVRADGKINGAAAGVKVYYDKNRGNFTPSANSSAKEVYLTVSQGALTSATTSTNANYTTSTNSDAITTVGSQIQFAIAAPADATSASHTYGAFAVVGDTNVNADWAENDVTVGLSYQIKAGNKGVKGKADLPSGCTVTTLTSGNAISINNFPAEGIDGAMVEKLAVHVSDATVEDWVLDAYDETQVQWIENTNGSYNVTIPASDDVQYYYDNYKGKSPAKNVDLLIRLDDGRVISKAL